MIRCYQGIDLVDIPAFTRVFLRHDGLLQEVFTLREREYCLSRKDPFTHLAGRFAAKEACLKAVGIGFSGSGIDHTLQEVEVANAASGRPQLSVRGWVAAMGRKRRIHDWSVSITHTRLYAIATVTLLGEAPGGGGGGDILG